MVAVLSPPATRSASTAERRAACRRERESVDDLRRAGGKQRIGGGREGERIQHTVAAGVEARQRAAVGRVVEDDDAAGGARDERPGGAATANTG